MDGVSVIIQAFQNWPRGEGRWEDAGNTAFKKLAGYCQVVRVPCRGVKGRGPLTSSGVLGCEVRAPW